MKGKSGKGIITGKVLLLLGWLFVLAAGSGIKVYAEVELEYDTIYVMEGDTIRLYPNKEGQEADWTSGDRDIARVSHSGKKLRGVRAGRTRIQAVSTSGKTKTFKVYVLKEITADLCCFIGHRGDPVSYPENTVKSMVSAMQKGCRGVELDVYYTKSGDLIVHHDATLLRMCGVDVAVADVAEEDCSGYPITAGYVEPTDTIYLATLADILKGLKSYKGLVFVHLKGMSDFDQDAARKELISTIRRYGNLKRTVVFCSDAGLVASLRGNGFKLGLSGSILTLKKGKKMAKVCAKYGFDYMCVIDPEGISARLVETAHDLGIRIGAYKVKTEAQAARLLSLDVDYMFLYSIFF